MPRPPSSVRGETVSPPRTGTPAESRLVAALIVAALALSCLPYLLGYFITPPGTQFIGTAYNIDDYCNYLSWLRQTAAGHFFLRNLFTTDPQKGLEFNVFFWLLGQIVRFGHVSPQIALQIARVAGGVGLLLLIFRFYRYCLPGDAAARLTAFGFACLSSGLGWLTWTHWQDKNLAGSPVDAWQPEAYTFLSLYTSALFTVSTLLIVGALYALLLGERTGRGRYAVIAGLCGAVLGNMHSYDVLHIAAAWGLFLVVWTVLRRGRVVARSWLRALLALALTLPTTLYQYYVFRAEAVFHERAEVGTLSPHVWYYVWGYGLVFVLALVALIRRRSSSALTGDAVSLFPVCWAVAGLLVIYLPVAFQRKMLMGEHVPLCLLAGSGAVLLAQRLAPRPRAWVLSVLVLASFPSNALFLWRDMNHLVQNRSETHLRPYLSGTLVDVYRWIGANTPAGTAVVGFPALCTALPGYTDRAVWAGHWGETPHYGEKEAQFARAMDAETSPTERDVFLTGTAAQYLFYPNNVADYGFTSANGLRHEFADLGHHPDSFLVRLYANKDYTVFRIGR